MASTPPPDRRSTTASRSSVASGVKTPAIRADPLADFEAKAARHEWFRLVELEVVHVRAVAAPDLQHIAEAGRRHERGLHAAALGDGVDDDGRPVDEGDDRGRGRCARGDRVEDTVGEIGGGRRDLRLAQRRRSPRRRRTTSVKVPPMSTATRSRGESLIDFRSELIDVDP